MTPTQSLVYPFVAIIGQGEMKLALLLTVIDPAIGGVMIMGHRGTGKSTTVRSLTGMMPPLEVVANCPYNCSPQQTAGLCNLCAVAQTTPPARCTVPLPVVDLPLGATEDRVAGTIDIEHALVHGARRFEPGLLARANRGLLYIDEVNLLEDHLVDLLLDVASSGVNVVEREGVSVRHPSRFALVGSGNPEEGELRPQLLDRFGLHAWIRTERDIDQRIEIVRRRLAFDDDPAAFIAVWESETEKLREKIVLAQNRLGSVITPDAMLRSIAIISSTLEIDGHRGELVMARAARARAAFAQRTTVIAEDIRAVATLALRHRLRKDPLEIADAGARIDAAIEGSLAL